jgi:mono/diheme cytochrome c family protein
VPPPRDFTDPAFGSTISRERLVAAITNGVPGTAMVAWQTELSAAEIGELADFILQNFITTPAPSTTFSRAPTGDTEAHLIYRESCSVCHGDDGKGAVWGQNSLSTTPRNFTTSQAKIELTRERMIKSVMHGRPGTPMPGFGTQLSEEQIVAVVDHIRMRFMGADMSAVSTIATSSDYHERPFPGRLVGNFERGRSLYFQNCLECHGATGDGDGPRAYFIFPRPRDFHEEATRETMNRPRLYDAVADGVNGREMPAWRFVFAAQDIADVSEFVYREFIATAGGTATP